MSEVRDELSADQVIQEICEVLSQADGDFIKDIANRVLSARVKFNDNGMFERVEEFEPTKCPNCRLDLTETAVEKGRCLICGELL